MLSEAKRRLEAQAWEEGEQLYRRVLETHEHDAEAYYGLGLVALARGEIADAQTSRPLSSAIPQTPTASITSDTQPSKPENPTRPLLSTGQL
jgi:hypothetical protein